MSRRSKRDFLAPELTPLIDVVFILLIFFIVSTKFQKEELALLLDLPDTEQGEGKKKDPNQITIEVSADKIAYEGQSLSMEELKGRLSSVDKKMLVNLRIDQDVRYSRVAEFLDLLQKYNLQNMSLITQKK